MTRTSSTMLNKSGESQHPCLFPDLKGNDCSFCPFEYDVICGVVIHGFYYIEIYSLYSHFIESFYHIWVPLRECLCLWLTPTSPWRTNPPTFHSQMLCGHLFQDLMIWDGESSLEFRPHVFQGAPPTVEISLQNLSLCP